ncbi:MAG: hypothetical protein JXR94_24245 [Candidatus Hydrogenedentes bacterium]|nr:hypothetical protein [Candidatus Hydrogenedentota bacterium]
MIRATNIPGIARAAVLAAVFALPWWPAHWASAAPEVNAIPDEQPAHPGEPFRIACEVSWAGEPDEFVIVSEIEPIDWGDAAVTGARAFVRDGRNVVVQVIEVVPHEPGEYMTPAISIAYLPPAPPKAPGGDGTEAAAPASDSVPTLRVAPFAIRVVPDRSLLYGVLGACAAGVAMALGWWALRRKRAGRATAGTAPAVEPDMAAFAAALAEAKQHRLAGEYYDCYRGLSRAAAALLEQELAGRLSLRAEQVGYRGARPTDDEVDSDVRALERARARYANDVTGG